MPFGFRPNSWSKFADTPPERTLRVIGSPKEPV
jgi:hypothetical protein